MNVLQHTRNERNLFFKRDRADRYYRDCLLIAEATNPVRRNRIGPFKREDGSLAVNDTEKVNL